MRIFKNSSYWKYEFHSAVLRYGFDSLPARFTRMNLYKRSSEKYYCSAVKYAEILEAYRYMMKYSKKANRIINAFHSAIMEQIKTFESSKPIANENG